MRFLLRLALALIPVTGSAQPLAPPTLPPPQASGAEDPLLQTLLGQALAQNPELAKAEALVQADQERIPQARALPDPSLSLGLQNDGFRQLQIGKMETSYYQVMLTQPLPWPGKRGLRTELARLGVQASRSVSDRTRLSLVANLKRAYFGLLLVRGQLELLDQQALLWQRAGEISKVRYQVGQGSQADLLRAQLEQNRLRQARIGLHADERVLLGNLNRLRGVSPDTPTPSSTRITELSPELSPEAVWTARAEQESPELRSARIGMQQAEQSLAIAQRDRYPDFAMSAGIMPRGSFDPMWTASVAISLPIWSRQKQHKAVAEQEYRRRAQGSESASVKQLLAQRIQERAAQSEAALDSLRLYREGLLVQSEASFQASLAQYEAGRSPFLSVLEALNGWIADRGGYLQALAQALAVQVAQEEFNLAGTPAISAQALATGAMGASAVSSPSAVSNKSGTAAGKPGEASSSMKSM